MPPKHKLHKATGKAKTIPPPVNAGPSTSSSFPEVTLTPEQAQQFEVELCWCIQQLQTGLKGGKLNEKQVQDYTKSLNILMSNSSSIVKKRQVMRLSFGDYRAKMAAEDKKLKGQNQKIKVTSATPNKNSVFIKKAAFQNSDNNFRFNFAPPSQEENIIEEISNIKLEPNQSETVNGGSDSKNSFLFEKSKNEFRFNFSLDS